MQLHVDFDNWDFKFLNITACNKICSQATCASCVYNIDDWIHAVSKVLAQFLAQALSTCHLATPCPSGLGLGRFSVGAATVGFGSERVTEPAAERASRPKLCSLSGMLMNVLENTLMR